MKDTVIPPEEMLDIIRSKDFSRFPEYMSAAAKEAYETLLHTGDGQLCDVIVDKAALEAVYQAGERAKDRIIKEYAESMVAIADIKIAVRSQKTAKTIEFMKRAMVPCKSLSIDRLAKAAVQGMELLWNTWKVRFMPMEQQPLLNLLLHLNAGVITVSFILCSLRNMKLFLLGR